MATIYHNGEESIKNWKLFLGAVFSQFERKGLQDSLICTLWKWNGILKHTFTLLWAGCFEKGQEYCSVFEAVWELF